MGEGAILIKPRDKYLGQGQFVFLNFVINMTLWSKLICWQSLQRNYFILGNKENSSIEINKIILSTKVKELEGVDSSVAIDEQA